MTGESSRYCFEDVEVLVRTSGPPGRRQFQLQTTQRLRSEVERRLHGATYVHPNPRTVEETPEQPIVVTENPLFDALFALAVEEARSCIVDSIQDGSFCHGSPLPVPGGCFETGRQWKYIWTRDISYSVDLALGWFDAQRSKNSLLFKLSSRRDGTDLQIVQDTGSGGSYPVSTDRVCWALGARSILRSEDEGDGADFARTAYAALRNTIFHDRAVIFDPKDGLYRGEQSFLDWREQTYPSWTKEATVAIANAKALSTNVVHLSALSLATELGRRWGEPSEQRQFCEWQEDLRANVAQRFTSPESGRLAALIGADGIVQERFELLGTSLAIVHGVVSAEVGRALLGQYPMFPAGPPVIFPQQTEPPIYHNRAVWPFVTAYAARAAVRTDHAPFTEKAVFSLFSGAARHLSNMENWEFTTGHSFVEDGLRSGPVVSSERQLWSVAGYLCGVVDVLFGIEITRDSLFVRPHITPTLLEKVLGASPRILLEGFSVKGHVLRIVVELPRMTRSTEGAGFFVVHSSTLDGRTVDMERGISWSELSERSEIRVILSERAGPAYAVSEFDRSFERPGIFAPRVPSIGHVTSIANQLKLGLDIAGDSERDVEFRIFRDGNLVADRVPGDEKTWTDEATGIRGASPEYVVVSRFRATGNCSAPSEPVRWTGMAGTHRRTLTASEFEHEGGILSFEQGRPHIGHWGERKDRMSVRFSAQHPGHHWIELEYANGAGGHTTGITCAVKRLELRVKGTSTAGIHVVFPHTGGWQRWAKAAPWGVYLDAEDEYELCLFEDHHSVNMSEFEHFAHYTAGIGGAEGRFNRINLAAMIVTRDSGRVD